MMFHCCKMGCAGSVIDHETRQIDKQLKKDHEDEKKIVKMLLLGTGDSGKSTIMKQVKILHNNGFTHEELEASRPIVYQNIFSAMNILLEGIRFDHDELKKQQAERICQITSHVLPTNFRPSLEDKEAVVALWKDPQIQAKFEKGSEFHIQDSAPYFFDNLDRIMNEDYVPSTEDVLKVRVMTTGVIEAPFQVKYQGMTLNLKMIDVGGQRSERRKWIHQFENIDTLIFVAALSEYNQVLFEDGVTNRMMESLDLFGKIVNNRFFEKSSFILFLNKEDLFDEKIKKYPLSDYYPKFEGPQSTAKDFIAKEYLSTVEKKEGKKEKKVYQHFTCATDTTRIKNIFSDVVSIIIQKSLDSFKLQ